MGNQLAKKAANATVVRPLKNYNVEDRAMKVISRDIPKAAPPHPSMQKRMDEIRSDPTLLTKAKEDPMLKEKLRQVYITSEGANPEILTRKDNLPQERGHSEGWEFGLNDPAKVPPGKLSFRQVLELLGKHQNDPENCTSEVLAKEYNLDVEVVRDILQYFRPFSLFTPKSRPQPSAFMKAIKA